MAWNHRSRVVAVAIAVQAGAGQFQQPNPATDLIAVASATNTHDAITAADPTATGTVYESNRVFFGKTATIGGTIPLRGPGGAQPPALGAWAPGRILAAGGWAEVRKAAATNGAVGAGSTTTAIQLANTESAVDGFLIGAPIQHASVGAGFQQTSIVMAYSGGTTTAFIPETLGAVPANGTNYTIPAYLSYIQGTLSGAPVYLSMSIWRDKKRYDYRDLQPSSIAFNVPVANEANTSFPDMTFQGKALIQAIVDDASPALSSAVLGIPVPPARGGKFYLDRVKLGHQQLGFTTNYTVAGASNQNQASGQDNYDILSANRQVTMDINQMAVADFDFHGREDAQTKMPVLSTWGMGAGNKFGLVLPSVCLDPFSPGDRNGYVSITGNAYVTEVDKAAALTIWW